MVAGKFVGFEGDPMPVLVGPEPVLAPEPPPINWPGPISGVSKTFFRWKWPKKRLKGKILTTNVHRCDGVPKRKTLTLTSVISTRRKWQMTTNRDVGESPLLYTRSLRDSVWKTVGELRRQCQGIKSLWEPETHVPGGETVVQFAAHVGQLLADK